MKPKQDNLQAALQSRKLDSVTKALRDLADGLAYGLKPPYTELVRLTAEEEDQFFSIRFSAKLYLHYTSLQTPNEGLVFTLQFSGEASADSPDPPIDELFSAGLVDSLEVFGYEKRWASHSVRTPEVFLTNLEVSSQTVSGISIDEFSRRLSSIL
jgi:hypothetical protein